MTFWDVVGKVASAIIEEGVQSAEKNQKRSESRLKDYERKIANAENSSRMSDPEYARQVREAKEKLKKTKIKMRTGLDSETDEVKLDYSGHVTIMGWRIEDWDSRWIYLGVLSSITLDDLHPYNKSIGLYKAQMYGEVYYIGKATEYYNGGFRKRLRDYVRDNNSARSHTSGRLMNENADNLHISILIVGNAHDDVEAVKALEAAMIRKYRPKWNYMFNKS